MTFTSPKTGAPVLRAYQIPHTHADLRGAAAVLGDMGGGDVRPDGPHARSRGGLLLRLCRGAGASSPQAASNSPTTWSRSTSTSATSTSTLSYAIVPPQIDRSKPAHKQSDPTLYAGVVKESDDGIVHFRRAAARDRRRLFRLSQLSCIHPLQPGDENYANGVGVPINAPGLEALSAPRLRLAATNSFDYPLIEPLRRDRLLRRARQRVRALGARLHLPQPRDLPRPVVEDAVAPLWQPPGAGALRDQAAFHDRACQAHERDDRQRCQSRGADRDGRARRARLDLENMLLSHEVGATIDADGVLWPSKTALYSVDGAAVRAQRPHAGDHPRAGRFGDDHAAVVGRRLRQPGDGARHRALHALGLDRRAQAHRS